MTYLRQPIISVLGHVSQQFILNSWAFCQSQKEHEKTSLLDYVRKSNITAKEAGGIN